MQHLKCIVFARPSSVDLVMNELRNPKYGSYYLFFSNILTKLQIEQLAEADEFELVVEVQEMYADYCAINKNLFSLNHQKQITTNDEWNQESLKRTVDGLAAVFASLKKKPVIRYSSSSSLAKTLAYELNGLVKNESSLFGKNEAVCLILDRQNDVFTPLVTPWTYQSMIHELLGIENGIVDLSHIEGIKEDMRQVVLNLDDLFFLANMHQNFGDLGYAIKAYLEEYQHKSHTNAKIDTISDMKRFVEAYPEFKRLTGNVSKHVTITGELSRTVDQCRLLYVSEIEQNICCSDRDQSEHVQKALNDVNLSPELKAKLGILYSLRKNQTVTLDNFHSFLLDKAKRYAKPMDPIETIMQKGLVKSVLRGLKGIENVYTQYAPPLYSILEQFSRNRLKDSVFPSLGSCDSQDLIVFYIGGSTFEEARFADLFQKSNTGFRVIVGGHVIHNSQSFLKQIHSF